MARRKAPSIPDAVLDQLLAFGDAKDAFGRDGLIDALKKALAERALSADMDHHLVAGEPDGSANSRNGFGAKPVLTDTGPLELQIPRDRLASFDPKLIAKYQRRFPGFDDKVISMYARGMSTRKSGSVEFSVADGDARLHQPVSSLIRAVHPNNEIVNATSAHFLSAPGLCARLT